MNAARYMLPHVYALSTSSPFWIKRNTGMKSYRYEVFKQFPRTGIPEYFNSVSEFDNFVNLLIKRYKAIPLNTLTSMCPFIMPQGFGAKSGQGPSSARGPAPKQAGQNH